VGGEVAGRVQIVRSCVCVFISRGQGHATAQTVTSPSAQHTSDRNRWCRLWQRNRRGRRRRLWSTSSPVASYRSAPAHTHTSAADPSPARKRVPLRSTTCAFFFCYFRFFFKNIFISTCSGVQFVNRPEICSSVMQTLHVHRSGIVYYLLITMTLLVSPKPVRWCCMQILPLKMRDIFVWCIHRHCRAKYISGHGVRILFYNVAV